VVYFQFGTRRANDTLHLVWPSSSILLFPRSRACCIWGFMITESNPKMDIPKPPFVLGHWFVAMPWCPFFRHVISLLLTAWMGGSSPGSSNSPRLSELVIYIIRIIHVGSTLGQRAASSGVVLPYPSSDLTTFFVYSSLGITSCHIKHFQSTFS